MKSICIMGIETSCDDTGIAIYDKNDGLIINKIYNQKKLHAKYNGIVPELAARKHTEKIFFLIKSVLKKFSFFNKKIHGIAYTIGPGLSGSLFVGATVGRALSYSWNIPAIPIHHIEAHLISPMMKNKKINFPFVGLIISGGHTLLINAIKLGKYKLLGKSLDDSIGEAFDKIAHLLNLKYPGGPKLEKLAKLGKKNFFNFPKPMINKIGMNFSFSGLKTFTANIIKNNYNNKFLYANIARAFQDSIIDILLLKCQRALKYTGYNNLLVSGGVSANYTLRNSLKLIEKNTKYKVFYASPKICTDNGAMIAYTGMLKFKKNKKNNLNIKIFPKWCIESI